MKFCCRCIFWLLMIGFAGAPTSGRASELDSNRMNQKRPNIIFLLTDDQATISMGCYGNSQAQTPNMDKLATRGVIFDNHYVTTAICMASRATIMTGLYEYRTGCNFSRGRMKAKHWQNSYPMLLRQAGYRTAMAGKFGFEIEGQKVLPAKDFDSWGGSPGQSDFATRRNASMKKYAAEFPHASRSYGAFGRDFIRESMAAKQPFCLSISFKAPHRPVQPDPLFDDVYRDKVFSKPKNYGRQAGAHLAKQSQTGRQFPRFKEWGYADDYDNVMRKYHQMVYGVDVAVGMILDELDAQGVTGNTVIVFTSDNGFLCGSHGLGSKVLPYEESTRVPLIIADPRKNSKHHNVRTRSLTGSVDLAPTILELAGLQQVAGVDGTSLVPLLRDPDAEVRKRLSLMNFWGPRTTHSFGVVTKEWKYVFWYSQSNGLESAEEMFDMKGERLELKNAGLDPKNQNELDRLRQEYDQAVYEIKEKAVNQDYRKYSVLFDRKQPWSAKSELLKKK